MDTTRICHGIPSDSSQFGFRRNKSTHQALLTFISILEESKKNKEDVFVGYLDLFKAYDTVEHNVLHKILVKYKLPLDIVELIKTIYQDNTAETFSPVGKFDISIKRGVKQGCGLSPLLFIIYLNPLLVLPMQTTPKLYLAT